jgi:hypothetical protein
MQIVNKTLNELTPYANNPRKNDEAVKYVAESIKQFGFKVPIVIDANGVIVAGHTRYKAARSLGLTEVPCIVADDLSDEQVQAFRLADNKVAELAEWDEELLKVELDDILDIDMEAFGFALTDDTEDDEKYTMAINIPQYEIMGDCPALSELFDDEKTNELIAEIEQANITDEQKAFLLKAATRHTAFNYGNIAEYYAHADEEMQNLMEKSALVIIDYKDAIRNGYASLNANILSMLDEGEDDA